MRRILAMTALGLFAIAAGAQAGGRRSSGPTTTTRAPRVAYLAARPDGDESSLYLVDAVPLGTHVVAPVPVATFAHSPGAAVRAAALPGAAGAPITVLAIADTAPVEDLSFAGSLVALSNAPGAAPRTLCDRVVHASRPLVTPAGRVFVSRGEPGVLPGDGTFRVDRLTVDEIDVATGHARPILEYEGYLTFLAGVDARGEVLVYRVNRAGGDLVAVDPDRRTVRTIAAGLLPFARDFSVDGAGNDVVFVERDERDPHAWVVDRVDLETGARTRLVAGAAGSTLAPHAWPGGRIAVNQGAHGLSLLGDDAVREAPLGDGIDLVVDLSADGRFAAVAHTVPGRLPVPIVVDTGSLVPMVVPTPAGERVTIAGFAP